MKASRGVLIITDPSCIVASNIVVRAAPSIGTGVPRIGSSSSMTRFQTLIAHSVRNVRLTVCPAGVL
jgi:hypothetical protein